MHISEGFLPVEWAGFWWAVSLPFFVVGLRSLIRITNLQLPVNEPLDYAQADFFITGQILQFEQAWVSSPAVELLGYGTLTLPDLTLDMRIRGHALDRIPLISGILENIRNELFTAKVTGPIADPEIGLESFNSTSRFFKKLVGATPSEADERLRRIEESAHQVPNRPRQPQADVAVPEQKQ